MSRQHVFIRHELGGAKLPPSLEADKYCRPAGQARPKGGNGDRRSLRHKVSSFPPKGRLGPAVVAAGSAIRRKHRPIGSDFRHLADSGGD